MDPLQLKLQQVNGVGQGLIQSAGKNCDVQGLEHDMEEINTRWNTLNKKVRAWGGAVTTFSGPCWSLVEEGGHWQGAEAPVSMHHQPDGAVGLYLGCRWPSELLSCKRPCCTAGSSRMPWSRC